MDLKESMELSVGVQNLSPGPLICIFNTWLSLTPTVGHSLHKGFVSVPLYFLGFVGGFFFSLFFSLIYQSLWSY